MKAPRQGPLLSRQQAIALGSKFFLGRPCKKHFPTGAWRYTSTNKCPDCALERNQANAEYYKRKAREAWESGRTRELYYANHEHKKAQCRKNVAEYRANNPDKVKEIDARSRAKRGSKHADASAKWRAENPEKQNAARAAWNAANPDKRITHTRARRARRKQAEGSHTAEDVAAILQAQGGTCAYCDSALNLQLDHKQPLTRGGTNNPDNLQYLCAFHNGSKHNKTHDEYMAYLQKPRKKHPNDHGTLKQNLWHSA